MKVIEDFITSTHTPLPAFDGEPAQMDTLIQDILKTKRCHNSTGELNFVAWLYKYLEALKVKPKTMAEGAVVVELGGKTLFSCHVDTVHSKEESDGSFQPLFFDPAFGHIFCGDKKSGCLGADDGAGIYIMLMMIEAGVKGSYIFHRGEEKGGISAYAMKDKYVAWLKGFNACIAFDRPDTYEVICTQGGQVCASLAYGTALAEALIAQGLDYEVSHRGVFTDSKVYRQLIPECINLGVGYFSQHSNSEYLDWSHLTELTKAVINVDWDTLKPSRKIVSETEPWRSKATNYYDTWSKLDKSSTAKPSKAVPVEDMEDDLDLDLQSMTREEISEYICDDPLAKAVIHLIVELDAERARVKRLQLLLGL